VRIAYLCSDLGVPVYGRKGASIHVRELSRALCALGHEVLIFTPRAGGEAPAGFGVPVCELPPDPLDESLSAQLAGDPSAGRIVARDVRAAIGAAAFRHRVLPGLYEFGPDLVYERHSLFGTAGLGVARELQVPLVVEVNAPLSDEQEEHRGLAFTQAARALEQTVLRSADRLVVVSSALERWLVGLGVDPRRVLVVPNAADPDRFEAAEGERDAVRMQLGLEHKPVVGFLGSLRPWHDTATLVTAVALLRARGVPAHLLIIGEGPERATIEDQIEQEGLVDATTFAGAIAHDLVPTYLAAVDVAAIPYRRLDGFYFSPLKLFECLATGRPVVAADVGEIGNVVREGETGRLYPPGDAARLADAIASLLEDPAGAGSIGRAGREHVRAHHTWEHNARAVVDLAEACLEQKRVSLPV
jgi:glycosyltransferase involved in cell wall biosynthesis